MHPIITRIIICIVLHCSASTFGNAKDINRWHLRRGFNGIGYHYVITRKGEIEQGRDINIEGAHTKGHNKNSIGICLILLPPKQKPTQAQLKSLKNLLDNLPKVPIYGHKQFKNKICPGEEIMNFITIYQKGR